MESDQRPHLRIGPTGQFPDGKLAPNDAGQLSIGIAVEPKSGNVIFNFGAPIRWFAMPPAEIDKFVALLQSTACKARKILKEANDAN